MILCFYCGIVLDGMIHSYRQIWNFSEQFQLCIQWQKIQLKFLKNFNLYLVYKFSSTNFAIDGVIVKLKRAMFVLFIVNIWPHQLKRKNGNWKKRLNMNLQFIELLYHCFSSLVQFSSMAIISLYRLLKNHSIQLFRKSLKITQWLLYCLSFKGLES